MSAGRGTSSVRSPVEFRPALKREAFSLYSGRQRPQQDAYLSRVCIGRIYTGCDPEAATHPIHVYLSRAFRVYNPSSGVYMTQARRRASQSETTAGDSFAEGASNRCWKGNRRAADDEKAGEDDAETDEGGDRQRLAEYGPPADR